MKNSKKPSLPARSVASSSHKLRVVLVEPEIPPNTGSTARLCAASNCELILLGKLGFQLTDAHLKRAGLDYWRFVSWRHHPGDPLTFLKELSPRSVHLFSSKSKVPYTHCPVTTGDYLVFGSEISGLSPSIIEQFSSYTIPHQQEGVRSLNLATAVGIVVRESLRRFAELSS